MVWFCVSRSPSMQTASKEQQMGDKLLTTPIVARGICLALTKFIIDPIEPWMDLKVKGAILTLSTSS